MHWLPVHGFQYTFSFLSCSSCASVKCLFFSAATLSIRAAFSAAALMWGDDVVETRDNLEEAFA